LRAVDRVLVEAFPKLAPRFLITGLEQSGDLGMAAKARYPTSRVSWFHFDLFAGGLARFQGMAPEDLVVEPDLPLARADAPPGERPDLIAFPFPRGGESLLAREMIEEAHDALAIGGKLLAATDGNPAWLKKVVREVFRGAEITAMPEGTVVSAVRTRAAPALKDHSHVVRLSERGGEFTFRTRPGVFSYGHIDQGSKALLALGDFGGCRRILDIGCGVGVLGIVAAATTPGSSVVLVDSNVRAVALARENSARNGVADVSVIASSDPLSIEGGPFDCVLANPPYFANFKIALRFIAAAHRQLAPGGRLWLVAKAAEEHMRRVEQIFGNAEGKLCGEYGVIQGVRR
jgi:16S rRNA (guanine1207-N2)-methyltransferase